MDGLINAWRAAFIAERATRYREGGMKIVQARIHAETDAALMELAVSRQPAAANGAARRRDVRLWMRHNAGRYISATELAEAADEVFRLPDGGLDNETHWVWDEAAEAVDDFQRGVLA